MFQTNEGPSFEAHQFLFSGTSAPTGIPTQQNFYNWFALDNSALTNNTGCSSIDPNEKGYVDGVKFDGSTKSGSKTDPWYLPSSSFDYSYPCYNHRTLIDLLEQFPPRFPMYCPHLP
jgi:hypothetical protein